MKEFSIGSRNHLVVYSQSVERLVTQETVGRVGLEVKQVSNKGQISTARSLINEADFSSVRPSSSLSD